MKGIDLCGLLDAEALSWIYGYDRTGWITMRLIGVETVVDEGLNGAIESAIPGALP